MKRLIVLATLATLLASASGCSMFNRMGAQSCETCDPTSPAPLLSRLRLPSISLPWRRVDDLTGELDSSTCSNCKEGFSEPTGFSTPATGFSSGAVIGGQVLPGQVYDGQVIDGVIVDDGFQSSSTGSTLYHPEIVGPGGSGSSLGSTATTYAAPNYTTRYAGELIPTPASPALDLAK